MGMIYFFGENRYFGELNATLKPMKILQLVQQISKEYLFSER